MPRVTKLLYTPWSAQRYAARAKCRTQRVINPQPEPGMKLGGTLLESMSKKVKRGDWFFYTGELPLVEKELNSRCPYGQPGDRLQLLTQWAVPPIFDDNKPSDLLGSRLFHEDIWTAFDGAKPDWCGKTRSPIYMPGWMREAMPHPEILSIEARRIHEITESECIEEGISVLPRQSVDDPSAWYQSSPGVHQARSAQESYSHLWQSINAKRGFPWESNPWVWNIRHQSAEELMQAS